MKEYEGAKDGLMQWVLMKLVHTHSSAQKCFKSFKFQRTVPCEESWKSEPTGEDFSIMRPTMIGNMLNVLEKNNN